MTLIQPADFGPKLISTMKEVLESAVDQIPNPTPTSATKAKMAHCILTKAAEGITDPGELKATAIAVGKVPAD